MDGKKLILKNPWFFYLKNFLIFIDLILDL